MRAVSARAVTISFGATRETRQYVASDEAPLRRAAFRAGDTITLKQGGTRRVSRVAERSGLLFYTCDDREICETELSHALTFNSPLDRLYAGQFDPSRVFNVRFSALTHQHRRRQSEVRGFVGGRIDLLPHQLGIAADVTRRLLARVLLADEVGLGKTIEACLIVHRLLQTGRARRILIVVPETLVHQWFLELLRRFNLFFHIFNEARCTAIQEARPEANPFLDDQLLLCDIGLLTENPARLDEAVSAGWDLVVVDEAHHLAWTPESPSAAYSAIERLGQATPGLLLLTATPEQLGVAGHFARLRLLDPDRFHDLHAFVSEAQTYQAVAQVARAIEDGRALSAEETATLADTLGESVDAVAGALANATSREALVERLLDRHGTGRVMFRNTRSSIGGFPARIVHLHRLEAPRPSVVKALAAEWDVDTLTAEVTDGRISYAYDPRLDWLVALLQDVAPDKVLLICQTPLKAIAIETALRQRTSVAAAAFHEHMSLIQRDRGAAWFADPEGARLLICSEIGSEGRNFQFAHHLVLFDLPLDAGLVEQRIGRLDRIGQRSDIHLHVPVVPDTHLAVMARWYDEGLDALAHHAQGSRELLEQFEPELRRLASRSHRERRTIGPAIDAFIAAVATQRAVVAARLEEGRDRLLERHSFRPARSASLVAHIQADDESRTLDDFMLSVFDLFFIEVEELEPRTYRLGSAGVLVDDFPGLTSDRVTVTTARATALAREDLQFLTWDHPLATGALDMLLSSERGNCALARWHDASVSALYIEVAFVLECLAPASLHVDRFLAPTPLRVAVDHRGQDATTALEAQVLNDAPARFGRALLERADLRDRVLPRMLERASTLAESRRPALIEAARTHMNEVMSQEVIRLVDLQKVNRLVTDAEIASLRAQQDALGQHLSDARLRIDSVRLIHRGPER